MNYSTIHDVFPRKYTNDIKLHATLLLFQTQLNHKPHVEVLVGSMPTSIIGLVGLNIYMWGSFSKNVPVWGRIFSKMLVFAFHLMLRLLRQKCIYELRKSHMQA